MSNLSVASELHTISSDDLAATTGGADPNITINPKLECPAGTSPNFTHINGKVNVKTPAGVGVEGQGSYTSFSCTPTPLTGTALRPGGDR